VLAQFVAHGKFRKTTILCVLGSYSTLCKLITRVARSHDSEWSGADWTGLVSPVKVKSSPMVEIRPTRQSWLLELTQLSGSG